MAENCARRRMPRLILGVVVIVMLAIGMTQSLSTTLTGTTFAAAAYRNHRFQAEPPAKKAGKKKRAETFGRRIVLTGAVTPMFERDLKLLAKECQKQAVEANQQAVLVIEIHHGKSKFGRVLDVVSLLRAADFQRVRTVAWVPKGEDISGNNVILALACNEIIMHPDASLGNIGNGNAADANVQQFVRTVVDDRHNAKLNWAIAKGMLDPQATIYKIKLRPHGQEKLLTRIVTGKELAELRQQNVELPEAPITLKEAGVAGIFTGSTASKQNLLVAGTRKTIEELAAIYNVPPRSLHASSSAVGKKKNVAFIRINGEIDSVTESFLERLIDRCEKEEKNVIIFEITSFSGLLAPSENLSNRIRDLDSDKIKTIAYIPQQAVGPSAMIALACDEIYMTPDAKLGEISPENMDAENDGLATLKTIMQTLAEKKHRPVALLEAMVNKNLSVYRVQHRDNPDRISYMSGKEIDASEGQWIKGRIVSETEEGDLLLLTGKRAHELGVSNELVNGTDDEKRIANLKAHLGLPANLKLTPLKRTWVDSVIFWLNSTSAMVLLLAVGVICIYLELQLMTGLLGIISALCFSLFFWSRFLGGTAGWLEVVLFLLGIACILMEVFVIPGFGVFGISGGVMLIASLIMASQTFGNLEPYQDLHLLSGTLGKLAISIMIVVFFAVTFSRYIHHIPFFNQLVLAPPTHGELGEESGPQLRPENFDERLALIGEQGETVTTLRPAGKADINGEYLDVVSDGPYITAGEAVEVVQVIGNRIVVRSIVDG